MIFYCKKIKGLKCTFLFFNLLLKTNNRHCHGKTWRCKNVKLPANPGPRLAPDVFISKGTECQMFVEVSGFKVFGGTHWWSTHLPFKKWPLVWLHHGRRFVNSIKLERRLAVLASGMRWQERNGACYNKKIGWFSHMLQVIAVVAQYLLMGKTFIYQTLNMFYFKNQLSVTNYAAQFCYT